MEKGRIGKALWVLYKLIGFIPYIALIVLDIHIWRCYNPDLIGDFGLLQEPLGNPEFWLTLLSLIGLWTCWYLLCKLVSSFLIYT